MNKKTKILLLTIASSFVGVGYASSADDDAVVSTDQTEAAVSKPERNYYMEVKVTQNVAAQSNNSLRVTVDYGRLLPSMFGLNEADIKNLDKTYNFSSEADALNLFAANGWTLASTYTTTAGRSTVTHYVMVIRTDDPQVVACALLPNKEKNKK